MPSSPSGDKDLSAQAGPEMLAKLLGNRFPDTLLVDEPMRDHTTFSVGGPADFMVEPESKQDVADAISIAVGCGAPWRVMGLGSNILVADEGLRGLTIRLAERFSQTRLDGCTIHAQAGASNKLVAELAASAGLAGYEFACGIPGSIGGAAIMNAGAYDGEFKDICTGVTCLTPDGDIVEVTAEEAAWGYRHSMMMDAGLVVLGATLELEHGSEEQIRATMADLDARRAAKQPLEFASAGSTFKRPTGYFAGKLVQDAGMRGHTVGGAQVSEKHCGFVVNKGDATAADVLTVIRDVQDAVLASAGVELQTEVRMWGFDD